MYEATGKKQVTDLPCLEGESYPKEKGDFGVQSPRWAGTPVFRAALGGGENHHVEWDLFP